MTPDAAFVAECRPSPNVGERRGVVAPDMLILHYTGMENGETAVRWLCMEASQVSCHYLVHEDGRIVQMVPERLRAWHAGAGSWRGLEDINSRSIGIEIVNPGHDNGYRPFPAIQMAAIVELCRDCVGRWPIPAENILAHSDIAPARKQDPGELFPWDQLFAAGLGHYVAPAPIRAGPTLGPGAEGSDVAEFQRRLAAYGYGVEITGTFDAATVFATIAFQRHFRPERVDGVADVSTRETLIALVEARNGPEAARRMSVLGRP